MHVIYIISGAWIDMNEQKERILKGTIQAFNEKGLKFTMDDLARILGMSKRPYMWNSQIKILCFLLWLIIFLMA